MAEIETYVTSSDQFKLVLTDSAVNKLKALASGHEGKVFRISVKHGGCSGLEYDFSFDHQADDDTVFEQDGVKILVNGFSSIYLNGVNLDYHEDLMKSGFNISNPNATKTCGCGVSFNV